MPSCWSDAADCVHVHVVVVQSLWGCSTTRFCQKHTKPTAHLFWTARLRHTDLHSNKSNPIISRWEMCTTYYRNIYGKWQCTVATSRAATSLPSRMIRKAKGCLGPKPGKTSTPWRTRALTWVCTSARSLWKYRVPLLTQHQRSFQHWLTRTFR